MLIVKGSDLLSAGMEYLLNIAGDMSIESISLEDIHLAGTLARFAPDVIVLDERVYTSALCGVVRLLSASPHLPVIVVSAKENLMRIYTQREFTVKNAGDLVDVVRSL